MAIAAVLAIGATQVVPRLRPSTGTLVIVGSGPAAAVLYQPLQVRLHGAGGWSALGSVSGSVPAAPDQRELLVISVAAGTYDEIGLGDEVAKVAVTVTSGQVEPVLVGIEANGLVAGSAYAGNDQVNLGLGELSGKFVAMAPFELQDQDGHPFNSRSVAGRDLVIAAFHTTCHETCPLYTALFFQLQKHLPGGVQLAEVTTDPGTDTPGVLHQYAQQIGAPWTFATGSPADLAGFWKSFGVELATGDSHVSTLVLVDRHGYVRLVYRGVPDVGHDVPASLVTQLGAAGLQELASGGDGWGSADVLQALLTITGPEQPATAVGGRAHAFSLTATDGTSLSLGQLAGHPLVINFWASYCPPCRAEMPMLERVLGAQRSAVLVLIDEGDSRQVALDFLRSAGVKLPSLLDSDLGVGSAYGAIAFPTTVFVTSDGTVEGRHIGQLDERVLAAQLSTLGN